MLFTADLRAFSQRLIAKIEVEQVSGIKRGGDGSEAIASEIKRDVILDKRVKPEFEAGYRVFEVHEDMMSLVKRRRRS